MHDAFDRFALWLEEVPGQVCHCAPNFSSHMTRQIQSQENTYIVEMAENEHDVLRTTLPRPPTCVTFKVDPDRAAFCKDNGMELPELPSRDLIGLRASCARVANMSAAEQIEQIYRGEEDTTAMACNGSTGDLLSSLLNARAIAVGS